MDRVARITLWMWAEVEGVASGVANVVASVVLGVCGAGVWEAAVGWLGGGGGG